MMFWVPSLVVLIPGVGNQFAKFIGSSEFRIRTTSDQEGCQSEFRRWLVVLGIITWKRGWRWGSELTLEREKNWTSGRGGVQAAGTAHAQASPAAEIAPPACAALAQGLAGAEPHLHECTERGNWKLTSSPSSDWMQKEKGSDGTSKGLWVRPH